MLDEDIVEIVIVTARVVIFWLKPSIILPYSERAEISEVCEE